MKQETKIILIGITTTLLVLVISLFTIYKLTTNKKDQPDKAVETTIPNNNASGTSTMLNSTVTVYIFKSSTCVNCKNALAFFTSILDTYDYLEVKTYEATDGDNFNLMQIVGKHFDLDKVTSVPFIIIGSDFHQIGYGPLRDEALKEAIEKEYENLDYQDLVIKLIEENPGNYPNETLKK